MKRKVKLEMGDRIIRIRRFSPENGENQPASFEQLFTLPGSGKMTVLQALQQVYEEQDPTLAFEYSCRYGRCGLCAVEVNGKPLLACTTFLQEGETTIGPLSNLPVLRDLVIDRRPLEELIAAKKIYFSGKGDEGDEDGESDGLKAPTHSSSDQGAPSTGCGTSPEAASHELFGQLQAPESLQKLLSCIECLCCHAACPGISANRSAEPDLTSFAGPYIFLKLAQLAQHPRDIKDRQQQAISLGLEYCRTCRKCRCPRGIPIYREAIEPLLPCK